MGLLRSTLLASLLLSLSSSVTAGSADTYHLQDTYIGSSFLSGFNWETFDDPSGGYVNYLDQGTALQRNLTYASGNKFTIRADDTNVVPSGARGRDSIRITSHKAYTDSVIILDLAHMPGGCGQWSAFWSYSPNDWPNGGEVDMIEGIHNQDANVVSLHTSEGCSMPNNRKQKGSSQTTDCNINSNYNSGCQTYWSPNTFGQSFNSHKGGYIAITRSASKGISMYFWSRTDRSIPPEITSTKYQTINVNAIGVGNGNGKWGTPQAYFPASSTCDFNAHFVPHNLVFDLTFCGPWADPLFGSSGCGAMACEDYVRDNPAAFSNAYWEINSLRVYTH